MPIGLITPTPVTTTLFTLQPHGGVDAEHAEQFREVVGEHEIVRRKLHAGKVVVDVAEHHFNLRGELDGFVRFRRTDVDGPADARADVAHLLDFGGEYDGFSRADQSVKRGPGDLGENHLLGKPARLPDQHAGGLSHAFNDQTV